MSERFHANAEITVPQCICRDKSRIECPYSNQEQIDTFFAEKEPVDNLEEDSSDMVG